MSTLVALVALPTALAIVWTLLHTRLSRGLGRMPAESRWRAAATPLVGGIGIYAGISAGIWAAVLAGPLTATTQLLGIYAGASLLFLAGLADDLWSLSPVPKLLAQITAATLVLATGTRVEIVHLWWIAVPVAVTLNLAVFPTVTVLFAGWTVIDGGILTVSVAALLVMLPALLVTTTAKSAPLSALVAGGVV